MEDEFVKWLVTLGVGGVLAGVIFWFYRIDSNRCREQWAGQTAILVDTVKEHTAALMEVKGLLEALHRRIDVDVAQRRDQASGDAQRDRRART